MAIPPFKMQAPTTFRPASKLLDTPCRIGLVLLLSERDGPREGPPAPQCLRIRPFVYTKTKTRKELLCSVWRGHVKISEDSKDMSAARSKPNVLITGTPGVGKTSTAEQIAAALQGFRHVNVGALVKEKDLHGGKHEDEEMDTLVLDEDKICDELEDQMSEGGNIVDFHTCDFFPERWFDLVVVLRCFNEVLYPRLEKRGYSEKKVQENVECEIMCVVAEDARESYREEILWELQSNSVDDLEANVNRVVHQLCQWGCTRA